MEIKAMPTFLLMSGRTPVDKAVGANPNEIRKRLDHFIHQKLVLSPNHSTEQNLPEL